MAECKKKESPIIVAVKRIDAFGVDFPVVEQLDLYISSRTVVTPYSGMLHVGESEEVHYRVVLQCAAKPGIAQPGIDDLCDGQGPIDFHIQVPKLDNIGPFEIDMLSCVPTCTTRLRDTMTVELESARVTISSDTAKVKRFGAGFNTHMIFITERSAVHIHKQRAEQLRRQKD